MNSHKNPKIITVALAIVGLFGLAAAPDVQAETIACFPLDTDPGWSTEGQWAFGVPLGGGSSCGDPTSGHTGVNVYGYNLAGDYTDSMPEYRLTTTAINCSGYENVVLSFWRWLGIESASFDHAEVEVSNNGSNWTIVWEHTGGSLCDGAWVGCVYDISAVADNQPTVYIRWTMGPTDSSVTYPGWNIDDICLSGDVIDDLSVTPGEDFISLGWEGGPFDPSSKDYTLTNTNDVNSLDWTVETTCPWLDIDPCVGTLLPGEPNSVTVTVYIDADANALPPGNYNCTVTFTNTTSGFVQTRDATLEVIALPAEIDVTDSIPPVDDLNMPFGDVLIGMSRTEQITITNADPLHSLYITDISLGAGFLEDFNDGLAQDWEEIIDPDWEVVEGEYRALTLLTSTWMQSTYTAQYWLDCTAQVIMRRTGYTGSAAVLFFRATDDFSRPSSVGSSYAVAISGNANYWVAKYVDGVWDPMQSWTNSPYLNTGEIPNVVTASIQGSYIEIYFNGYLAWSGSDSAISEPGRIGLICYNSSTGDTTHYFDDVLVTEPTAISQTISAEQQWYNEHAYEGGNPETAPKDWEPPKYPGKSEIGGQILPRESVRVSSGDFRLENVPNLPATIAPLGHNDVNVVFEPTEIKSYQCAVVIKSNDEDEAEVEVLLSGNGILDYLEIVPEEQLEFSGHPGGPFVPTSESYQLMNNGPNNIGWAVEPNVPWLDVNSNGGTLKPDESISVIVRPNAQAELLPEGYYCADVNFTNVTTTVKHVRRVCLDVFTAPKIWINPAEGCLTATVLQGETTTEVLTIGNTGDANLHFTISSCAADYLPCEGESAGGLGVETDDVVVSTPLGHDFTVPANVPFAAGELLVRFAPVSKGLWPDVAEKNAILAKLGGATVEREYRIVPGLCLVKLPVRTTVEEALVCFNKAAGILYAEPNYELKLISTCQRFPNDPRFDELWGLHNTGQTGGTPDADIDAPEAWCIRTDANDIIVAVIDTGVDYTHVDLAANMWVNEAEYYGTPGVDDDGNGYVDDIYGYDFRNYDGDPMDDNGHGTHCSGTIGAVGDNDEGVVGVCWNVKIMALKFLGAGGTGSTDDAISCIEYSILMGANLSSNSWGGGGYSQALKDAIDDSNDAGMLFAAAAGNDGEDTDVFPHYPSSYDCNNIISVLSTNRYDNISNYSEDGWASNYGLTSVDLGAPGSDILSCAPGDDYDYSSGTSMATPHVSGACALIWSLCPELSHLQIKDIICRTVDPIPALEGMCLCEGRLNVHSAIVETQALCGVPWLEFVPEVGIVAAGDANDVNVVFCATGLEVGDYYAEIIISSDDEYTPTKTAPAKMTVLPDVLVVTPQDAFESTGVAGGPFTPRSKSYTLTNDGNEPLAWTAVSSEIWLDVEPNDGILDPCDSNTVKVTIDANANTLDPNTYVGAVTFTNITNGVEHIRPVTLIVTPPDYFTELFDPAYYDPNDPNCNDLANRTLIFIPDGSGSYYSAYGNEAVGFPVDPNGGVIVSFGDDDYETANLQDDKVVNFYGTSYDTFYIGSNGYITFISGDLGYIESFAHHFDLPRISALFDDLDPNTGGTVSWKQLGDRVAVTFENVPEYSLSNANSFQVEMFFGGILRITLLDIAAFDGLVGLSEGNGLPSYFVESDLSEYNMVGDIDGDHDIDFADYAVLARWWMEDCNDQNNWCQIADSEFDGVVDYKDLSELAERWLKRTSP